MTLPTITTLPTAPSRSNTPATFNSLADAFMASFPGLVSEINAFGAALPAVVNGIDYNGTSTTSLTIGTGSKSLTVQTGKNFQIGQSVRIAYTTTPSNYMDGQVTAYNSGTGALVVNVASVGGAGTQALWTISLSPGAGSFATLAGAETLTSKTLTTPTLSGTASGTGAGVIGYLSGALTFGDGTNQRTVVTTDNTQTLTNKTIDTAGTNVLKVNGNTLAASAGTATLTFPNASTTLVGRDTTDTLTNKTLTAPALNAAVVSSDSTVTDTGTIAATSVGFRGLPVSANASGTLALTDAGKMIVTTGNWTIPANASIAFPAGSGVVIFNNSGASITVGITTDTLRLAGTATTGTRTIPAYGIASLTKPLSTTWLISGTGLT